MHSCGTVASGKKQVVAVRGLLKIVSFLPDFPMAILCHLCYPKLPSNWY